LTFSVVGWVECLHDCKQRTCGVSDAVLVEVLSTVLRVVAPVKLLMVVEAFVAFCAVAKATSPKAPTVAKKRILVAVSNRFDQR
jgi:hypothetical protein